MPPATGSHHSTVRASRCARRSSFCTQRAVATGRENLVFRVALFCGLRPALRIEDLHADRLRIDEAVQQKEKGRNRIGDTKTESSDAWVSVPPDLARDLHGWVAKHPSNDDPKAFLFPTTAGTAYRVGNFVS